MRMFRHNHYSNTMAGVRYILLLFFVGSIGAVHLRDLAQRIYVGTCLGTHYMNDSRILDMAGAEFNMITPEWEMKWAHTEIEQGVYTYELADKVVKYAQEHKARVRGHTLIWYIEVPKWVPLLNKTALHAAIVNRVQHATNYYKGKVYAWDVVNEVLDDNGGLRQSIFYQNFGESYISESFQLARKADPSAKLYINDYNVESINPKSNGLYNLVKKLKAEGVPIDGVGIQAHMTTGAIPSDFAENLKRFIALDVEVAITELDILIEAPVTQAKLEQQAKDYAEIYTLCKRLPKCVGVTVWGFVDKYSWASTKAPCLWDDNMKPKPALAAVEAALKQKD